MQVREAVELYKFAILRLSPKTQEGYVDCLDRFIAWCEANHLTLERVKAPQTRIYLDQLAKATNPRTGKPYSSYYVHYHARVLRAFLRWCHAEEDTEGLVTEKAAKVAMPRLEKHVLSIYTPDELTALLAACKKEAYPELQSRSHTAIMLLIDTGIRAGELCGLTLENVCLTPGASYIKVFGKGLKEREVGLGRKASKALYTHIHRYRKAPQDERHVFLSRSHTPLTVNGLQQMIYRIGEWAGVEAHPHKFRHTFAVRYLEAGGSVFDLARLMGHTTTEVTKRYLECYTSTQARHRGISVLDTIKA
jgi:integrase/recombinase XerD